MIIELNARPGLAIQVANCAGLLPRITAIEALNNIEPDPQVRVNFSKENFSTTLRRLPPRKQRTRATDHAKNKFS